VIKLVYFERSARKIFTFPILFRGILE
jgi:hypothetical protein